MATVIEAKAVITAEDKTGAAFSAIEKKLSALGKGAKVSAEVDRLTKSLGQAEKQLAALDRIGKVQTSFDSAKTKFQQAGTALRDASRAMAEADRPTRQLESSLKKAQAAFDGARAAFQRQRSALTEAAGALGKADTSTAALVAEQNRLKAAVDGTTAAIARQLAAENRQQARRASRREAIGVIAAGTGIVAATRGKDLAKKAIVSAAEFDIGVRKQRAFTDIGEAEQGPLIAQAKKIGQETPFSNLDVVKAQTKAMQGMPAGFGPKLKAEVAQGILENVKNYALVMEADLETSAEAIRSYLLATGKDIGTKEKALTEANKATNQLVKMAKLGGMNDEDVQQFMKFAASSGTTAGLSTETLMSLGALARRGGLRGDEAGVFIRSASSKLVSPTKQGRAALNAAGINFDNYVSMPQKLETSRLETQFKTDMGVKFTPGVRAKLDKILADPKIIGDRGAFTTAVTEAVSEQFGKTKKGTLKPADRVNIAKSAGTFQKLSAGSVDTEQLLDDAMKKDMTLPQLNAWLTDKHGGKGAISQRQWDEFKASRQEIVKAGDDPDFAKTKAQDIMAGLGGSFENLKGSVENLILSLGTANEGILKLSFDKLGAGLDSFASLSTEAKQAASAIGLFAGTATAAVGGWKLLSAVVGAGGLSGSATALTASAAALDAAAVKLAGGSAVGTAAASAGAAGATGGGVAAWLGGALPWILRAGAAATAGMVAIQVTEKLKEAVGAGMRPDAPTVPTPHNSVEAAMNSYEKRLSDGRLEATVKPDQITAKVTEAPKLEGSATVTVRVEGPGQITNTTSSGHIRAQSGGSTGTSMPGAGATERNW